MTNAIHVGNLPASVSEADLFELFKQHGPLKVIKIPRDPKLRTPLGHAYVTFYNPDHAVLAHEALQESGGADIRGTTVTCSLAPEQSATSTAQPAYVDPSRSVFVRDLREGAAPEATKASLEAYGNVALQPKGPNAFVAVFPSSEDAAKALAEEIDQLEISPVRDPKTFYTNLFVRGLSPDTTEEVLRGEFEKHGEVTSLLLPLDENHRAKGFGFVNFVQHKDAVSALEALDNTVLCGETISVSRAQSKVERQAELKRAYEANRIERLRNSRGTNLYITSLNPSINNERLRAYFSKFGEITSVRIMLDPAGNSKGFGFVCFRDPDHASNAIAEMHNRTIEGNVLQVAIAHKKDPQSAPYSLGKRFPQGQHAPPPQHSPHLASPMVHMHHPMSPMMVPMPMHPVMVPMMVPRRESSGGSSSGSSSSGNTNSNGKYKKRQPMLQPYGNISASVAAAATPQAAKEIVGETLYPIVQRHPAIGKNADVTAHVTGIMLQHDNADILSWLEDEQLLNKRIQQAHDAYKEYKSELK